MVVMMTGEDRDGEEQSYTDKDNDADESEPSFEMLQITVDASYACYTTT